MVEIGHVDLGVPDPQSTEGEERNGPENRRHEDLGGRYASRPPDFIWISDRRRHQKMTERRVGETRVGLWVLVAGGKLMESKTRFRNGLGVSGHRDGKRWFVAVEIKVAKF